MAETIAPESGATAAPKGLFARAMGVVLSPRATYAQVIARPKWLGMLVLVAVVSGGAVAAFLSTEVGRRALVDKQITQLESFGRPPTQAQLDRLEATAPFFGYFALAFQAIFLTIGAVAVSATLFVVFSALLGGDGTFKQFFAVVAHSGCILAVQQLFVLPLDYVNKSLTSPTNVGVFLPMLDENSFVARTLGAIDLFLIWWIVSLAIGVGALTRRSTVSIATALLAVYAVIALVIAAVKTALAGA